jgi:hypothetical protein
MIPYHLISDQLYYWSAIYENTNAIYSTKKTFCSSPATTRASLYPSRIAYRAIQTLWQAWLQVCSNPRTRSQVLLVRQSARLKTANGLRPSRLQRPGRRLPGKLPSCPRDPRRSMQDQSGTAFTKRRTLINVRYIMPPVSRHPSAGHTCRQYARDSPLLGMLGFLSRLGGKR